MSSFVKNSTTVAADRQTVKAQLIETVSNLCRSILPFETELTVEGLVGITLDNKEIVLININETLTRPVDNIPENPPDICETDALISNKEEGSADILSQVFAEPLMRKRRGRPRRDDVHHFAKLRTRMPSARITRLTRRRRGRPRKDDVRSAIVHSTNVRFAKLRTRELLPRTAKLKRHCLESCSVSSTADACSESTSASCRETEVRLQSLSSLSAREIIAESHSQESSDRLTLRCSVKLENTESVADQNNLRDFADGMEIQCDRVDISSRSSVECRCVAGDDDGERLISSEPHCSSDASLCADADVSGLQLVIGDVFTLKDEPTDCAFEQHNIAVIAPDENQVCQSQHQFSPLQRCQVELIAGSGVFVSGLFYASCYEEPAVEGCELVRRLVREVFTDEEILIGSTYSAKKQRWTKANKVLNEQKVCAIKEFALSRCADLSHDTVLRLIDDAFAKTRCCLYVSVLQPSRSPT